MCNTEMTVNGVTKPFLEWCKEYNASPLQVRALVSLGFSFEEALQARAYRRIVLIQMNGQVKAFASWCKLYNVSPWTAKKRISAGYTLEEAFNSTRKVEVTARKTVQRYAITKPFLEWCNDYFASPLHVRAAVSLGNKLENALMQPHKNRVSQLIMRIDGQVGSFLDLCAQYGKSPNTIRKRVSMGFSMEDAFSYPPFKRGELARLLEEGKVNQSYTIKKTLASWCRDYNISEKIVQRQLDEGIAIDKALSPKLTDTFEINGKQTTLKSFCVRFGLDPRNVRASINKGMDILDAVDYVAYHTSSDKVSIDGKALKEARQRAGLTQAQLAELINSHKFFAFTKQTIHYLEKGKRLISLSEYQVLEAVLGVDGLIDTKDNKGFIQD